MGRVRVISGIFAVVLLPFLLPFLTIATTPAFDIGEINITSAQHLTNDYLLIQDITEQVQTKDNQWSNTIKQGDIIRVSYEKNLSTGNVIDVYARS